MTGGCELATEPGSHVHRPEPAPTATASKPRPPGQDGPNPELLASLQDKTLQLRALHHKRPTKDGQQQWLLELHQADTLLASWPAVSGRPGSQRLDRRWSPGNGAPFHKVLTASAHRKPGVKTSGSISPPFRHKPQWTGDSPLQSRQRLCLPAGSCITAGPQSLDGGGRAEAPQGSELMPRDQLPSNAS